MSDMELVIKIPEDLYKATVNGLDANEIWDLRLAVKNGTPLPEEYGNLIDFNSLEEVAELMHTPYGRSGYGVFVDDIREYVRPIISSVDKGVDTSESEGTDADSN